MLAAPGHIPVHVQRPVRGLAIHTEPHAHGPGVPGEHSGQLQPDGVHAEAHPFGATSTRAGPSASRSSRPPPRDHEPAPLGRDERYPVSALERGSPQMIDLLAHILDTHAVPRPVANKNTDASEVIKRPLQRPVGDQVGVLELAAGVTST